MATEWRGEVSGDERRGLDAAVAGRSHVAASPWTHAATQRRRGKWGDGGLGFGVRGHIGQGRLGGPVGLASWAGAQWRGSFLLLFLFYFLYFPFTVLL